MKRTALALLLLAPGAAALEWVQLHPEGEAPTPRSNSAAVYDPAGHRVIIFGGLRAGGDLNDVWELGLAPLAWRKITPDSGPKPDTRWSHNAVYDPAGRRMLVWSGRHLGDFFNDVWAFDLRRPRLEPVLPGNPARLPLRNRGRLRPPQPAASSPSPASPTSAASTTPGLSTRRHRSGPTSAPTPGPWPAACTPRPTIRSATACSSSEGRGAATP